MRTLIAAAAILCLAVAPARAGQIWLTMDQVRPYEIERPAGQIVVGNPEIADVTVHDKKRIFLFGKAPGLTNMIIFDEKGEAIETLVIRVRSNTSGMLTFHRGAQRTTYNCTTECDATITVGDGNESFTQVASQVAQKQQGGNQ
ncbi:pilus assembly protein N-terminal domain-containing protein [Amphiplicatus metriothermophilus]|uniref:Pilus formation protein N terminal region n=1 Tax=Amphiplicatus metriothermophilus TaxID=1519374 RepID=A0A239PIQ9_9PROT|nr:pilus assembly protein N-terminal domain-containing protein [Amphiplicatus metriothermophilus]MBB5517976.1 Flp pilus assembly secretin CpaC [Amphiplicatus metriothermophilus]SNT67691.1 Pilus formation protein N terminal region [Amphiplicatus metriothermophilus]